MKKGTVPPQQSLYVWHDLLALGGVEHVYFTVNVGQPPEQLLSAPGASDLGRTMGDGKDVPLDLAMKNQCI